VAVSLEAGPRSTPACRSLESYPTITSINKRSYTRAQRSDYDAWDTPGWSANELWPFLKKVKAPGTIDKAKSLTGMMNGRSKPTTEMGNPSITALMDLSMSQTEDSGRIES